MKRLLTSMTLIMAAVALTAASAVAQETSNTAAPAATTLPITTVPAGQAPAATPAAPAVATPAAAPADAAPVTPAPETVVPATAVPVTEESLYRINGGDTIHISVYGERD